MEAAASVPAVPSVMCVPGDYAPAVPVVKRYQFNGFGGVFSPDFGAGPCTRLILADVQGAGDNTRYSARFCDVLGLTGTAPNLFEMYECFVQGPTVYPNLSLTGGRCEGDMTGDTLLADGTYFDSAGTRTFNTVNIQHAPTIVSGAWVVTAATFDYCPEIQGGSIAGTSNINIRWWSGLFSAVSGSLVRLEYGFGLVQQVDVLSGGTLTMLDMVWNGTGQIVLADNTCTIVTDRLSLASFYAGGGTITVTAGGVPVWDFIDELAEDYFGTIDSITANEFMQTGGNVGLVAGTTAQEQAGQKGVSRRRILQVGIRRLNGNAGADQTFNIRVDGVNTESATLPNGSDRILVTLANGGVLVPELDALSVQPQGSDATSGYSVTLYSVPF